MACLSADTVHEVIGHLLTAWLTHVQVLSLSTVALQTAESSRLVAAAGTIANILVGLFALGGLLRMDGRASARLFLWVFAAFNLFNCGYLIASALLGTGDWAVVTSGLSPAWAWRVVIASFGVALYAMAIRLLCRSMLQLLAGGAIAVSQLQQLVTTVYLAGGAVLTVAAVFNPVGPQLILLSGVGASFGLSLGLMVVPGLVLRHLHKVSASQAQAQSASPGWLALAIALAVAFIAVLGPGIRFG